MSLYYSGASLALIKMNSLGLIPGQSPMNQPRIWNILLDQSDLERFQAG